MIVDQIRELARDLEPRTAAVATEDVLCGFPSPSRDYQTNELDLNEHLMPNRVASFIIRARGHSMIRAGIFDGDELIVDRSFRPEDGHVVVAVVDGEMTVKRLRITGADVVHSAENPHHPDIEIPELSDLRVWGVVTRSLHRVIKS